MAGSRSRARKGQRRWVEACLWSVSTLALLAGGTALAGGPDVIVGDLDEIGQYTTSSEDPQAYAMGTVSCNIGDVNLKWFANTVEHPVIGQNMFRIVSVNGATRIEQIGQAWLKHGFTALAGNICSTCNGVSGTFLGVGCSDPYSAGLNAATSNRAVLGPKSNVNAATGAFPYTSSSDANLRYDYSAFPGGTSPASTGNAARRVQVLKADLNDTAAQFIIESQYVALDDATTGNKWNNASYRRVSIANTGTNPSYGISFPSGSTTQRTKPAIYAWQEHGLGANTPDPNVVIQALDIPGDGRIWVGYKVTNLGGGLYNYDYVIQNLTSDRSINSVIIPIAPGTTVSSTGFRDVRYHSGEENVYDATDWNASVTGSAVTFTAPAPPANRQANAIRWGTMYNFRIVANAAPTTAGATFGLLKTGSFPSVGLLVATPGGTAGVVTPANDLCANAVSISDGPTGGTTGGTTSTGPDECTSRSSAAINNDVWYRYTYNPTSACAGNLTFSLCGSTFDTRLAVYSGTACPTAPGTAIACNDDNTAVCGTGATTSQVSVPVTTAANQQFLIRVGGFGSSVGNFTLNVTPPSCGPVTGACCTTSGGCTVVQASNCTGTSAYQGDNTVCSPSPCPAVGRCCVAASGACSITFQSNCSGSGQTWTAGSTTCTPNPCPQPPAPTNDLCANAIWVADGVGVAGNNSTALTDGAVQSCGSGNSSGRDLWYKYRPATTGNVRVTTDQNAAGSTTNFDTVLSVHSACGAASTTIACDDDAGTSPGNSSDIAAVALTAGNIYYIRVAGYGSSAPATGAFGMKVIGGGGTIPAPPSNDDCQNRRGTADGPLVIDTTDATTDGPVNAGCSFASPSQIDKDVWFNYPAQVTGTLTISLCGAPFDTRIAVYRDPSCTNFDARLVGCNDDFCGSASQLTVNIEQGVSYVIRVGGVSNAGGQATMNITSQAATGACCRGATCGTSLQADCTGPNSRFTAAGSSCNASGNNTSPCCKADFTQDGVRTIDDMFVFINAWFVPDRSASITTNGTADPVIDDIFVFINVWFAAGCG